MLSSTIQLIHEHTEQKQPQNKLLSDSSLRPLTLIPDGYCLVEYFSPFYNPTAVILSRLRFLELFMAARKERGGMQTSQTSLLLTITV